jgi:hypothetical protein
MKIFGSILLMAAVFAAGCNAITARGPTAAQIEQYAIVAENQLPLAKADKIEPAAALVQIADNATIFRAWADQTTLNGLAYLFGAKEIWADAIWYGHIHRDADRADQQLRRATTRPALANKYLVSEYRRILILRAVKQGVTPPE